MNKPKGFIHKEGKTYNGYRWVESKAWIVGRVRVTYDAVGALVFIGVLGLSILQVILGVVSGWSNWVPLLIASGVVLLILAGLILSGIISFFRWIAGEITLIKPGE